ncbi:MAG: STAS domain-containing protein [Patescibacteria group bacterium]
MNNFAGVTIEEKMSGKNKVFSIEGDLVIANATKVQNEILGKMNGETDVILDLREVSHMDCFSIGTIVKIKNELSHNGVLLRVVIKEGHVKEEFDKCRLGDYLDITIDSRIIEDAAA